MVARRVGAAPYCPLLLAARAAMVERHPGTGAEEPMYRDPAMAPGVACVGSACAYWLPVMRDRGVCGTVPNAPSWGDPAAPQTTPDSSGDAV